MNMRFSMFASIKSIPKILRKGLVNALNYCKGFKHSSVKNQNILAEQITWPAARLSCFNLI